MSFSWTKRKGRDKQLILGFADEHMKIQSVTRQIKTCTHTHIPHHAFVSFTHTYSLTHTMPMTLTTHTHREQCLSEQTHIIVQASCSLTITLRLFESPLNNLDLLSSRKTHESQSYDVIGVRGQDCDAYTVRLPVVLEETPTLFVLTYWSSYRTIEKQRRWSQKHRIDHFLLNLSSKVLLLGLMNK